MNSSLRFLAALLVVLGVPRLLAAQSLDPSFRVSEVYKSGSVRQVVEQPDGKRLVLGVYVRVAHQQAPPTGLVRLLANSTQPDPGFLQNIAALTGEIQQFLLLNNGKILVAGINSPGLGLQSGAVFRQALMLLNADGTPDASFNAGIGPNAYILHMLQQPDGKIILCGAFSQFSGRTVSCMVRLLPTGILDTAFQAATPTFRTTGVGVPSAPQAYCLALQADGRILLGGNFVDDFNNAPPPLDWGYRGIVRLLPSGQLDSTFQSYRNPVGNVFGIAIQADGKILAVDNSGTLTRLLPATGFRDAVLLRYGLGSYTIYDTNWIPGAPVIQIQPGTGRIIVMTHTRLNATVPGTVVAFTATGTLDTAFNNATAGGSNPYWVHISGTGQLLVGGPAQHIGGAAFSQTALALLTTGGLRDISFGVPLLQTLGAVSALALQPDGKIVVGGEFSEINGLALPGGLARLNANGQPDSLYSVAAAPAEGAVTALALQADGKLLVGGTFSTIGGGSRSTLARLLTTGQLDAAYAPAFTTSSSSPSQIVQLMLQPDGRLLMNSNLAWTQGGVVAYPNPVRLMVNGQLDNSFQPSGAGVQKIMLQPDGKILASGRLNPNAPSAILWRWLPTGTLDNTFAPVAYSSQVPSATLLAQDGQNRVCYRYSQFVTGSGVLNYLGRLRTNGQSDPSFAIVNLGAEDVQTMVVQPNQRLLSSLADYQNRARPGTWRLLPSGATDASYLPVNGPDQGISQILIQPDGAILMAGQFTSVGGLPTNGIARLIDANVLTVAATQTQVPTIAWPNPAHNELHLALTEVARPQRVTLLDALGKTVLTQPATQPELTLNTAALAPGLYLLRVDYASGPVTRRIVIE